MGKLVLITGGARSGKSSHAVSLAGKEAGGAAVTFVATCVPGDDEMRSRIRKHKDARPPEWPTLEESKKPSGALGRVETEVAIIDCITLLIFNLVSAGEDDERVLREISELAAASSRLPRAAFVVTNEVGSGIVPADALTRRFRDLCGKANQILAACADEVLMMVSGIPLKIK